MKGNIMYKLRVERMQNHSWVKKVYKDGGNLEIGQNPVKD